MRWKGQSLELRSKPRLFTIVGQKRKEELQEGHVVPALPLQTALKELFPVVTLGRLKFTLTSCAGGCPGSRWWV